MMSLISLLALYLRFFLFPSRIFFEVCRMCGEFVYFFAWHFLQQISSRKNSLLCILNGCFQTVVNHLNLSPRMLNYFLVIFDYFFAVVWSFVCWVFVCFILFDMIVRQNKMSHLCLVMTIDTDSFTPIEKKNQTL